MQQTKQQTTQPDGAAAAQPAVLSVRDLWVEYRARRGAVQAVRGVSFDLLKGETLALIGESGSGKTTLALALMRLLARSARIRGGRVLYRRDGREVDVLSLKPGELRRFRWSECAIVFQSALNALNPVLKVWDQIFDAAAAHGMGNRQAMRRRAIELLQRVQLDAERVLRSYPHELSGGMRQRVLLAMALVLNPQILILDEPTTALDILTQRAIIDLLRELKQELGFSVLLVSHDLSLAAELADRVATMYAGRIVELGTVEEIFYQPHHPYTVGLLKAVPTLAGGFRPLESVRGSPPDLIALPPGCKFHPRCPFAEQRCLQEEPELLTLDARGSLHGHAAACWYAEVVAKAWQSEQGAQKEAGAPTGMEGEAWPPR
jgi:peptide/nickel transport system ATP-binding protein